MLRSALLNVMIKAVHKAGRMLKRDFGEIEQLQVSLKGPANFVSAADRRAEEILHAELERARPGCGSAQATTASASRLRDATRSRWSLRNAPLPRSALNSSSLTGL